MARAAAALSVLAFLLLGAGAAGDEPALLLALVGTALCALGCVGGSRTATAPTTAVVVPGRRTRPVADGVARQHRPDAAGRPRPRAPGAALATT